MVVHPVSLQAAALDDAEDGLQAKFSIPYLAAFTLLHGPRVESFGGVDDGRGAPRPSTVYGSSGRRAARVGGPASTSGGQDVRVVEAALGSPARPMTQAQLAGKVRELAGRALEGVLDDPAGPPEMYWRRSGCKLAAP